MRKTNKVRVRIKSIEGKCPMKFKVGRTWVIDKTTPGGMCQSAYQAIFSALRVLRFGGSQPWDKKKGIASVCCPDPENRVVYELERIGKK